jgi:hypothetical protein
MTFRQKAKNIKRLFKCGAIFRDEARIMLARAFVSTFRHYPRHPYAMNVA